MRISSIALYTLTTLTMLELVNEAGQAFQVPSDTHQPSVANPSNSNPSLRSIVPTAAISAPETVVNRLAMIGTAPAFAAEAKSPELPQVSSQKPSVNPHAHSAAAATSKGVLPAMAVPANFDKLSSAQVVYLQQQLKAQGFNPGLIDGIWGPRTEAAVTQFQQARKLQADGMVGVQTWKALSGESRSQPIATQEPTPAPKVTAAAPASTSPPAAQAPPQANQIAFNVRLIAGFITGFALPVAAILTWQMLQSMRGRRDQESPVGSSSADYSETPALEPTPDPLPTEDQQELQSHCRAIAEILTKNAPSKAIYNFEDLETGLRVQYTLLNSLNCR